MYNVVGSGKRRSFELTVGLREGYDDQGKTHDLAEAQDLAVEWLKARAAAGKPFLPGTFFQGEVCYAWPEGPGKAGGGHEPVALYRGEVNPIYNAETTDEGAKGILTDLASFLGERLGQARVYLVYCDEVIIFQKEKVTTPTGE